MVWYFYRNRQGLELFASLSVGTVFILLGLFTLQLFLYTFQFYLVLRQCSKRFFPFLAFFKTIVLGRFLSSIAPQAGGVFRAVYLKTKFGVSYTHYISGSLAFLWIDAAMNIVLSAAVVGYFAPTFHIKSISVWWILAAMTAFWLLPIAFELVFRKRSTWQGHWLTLHQRISEMLTIVIGSIRHRKMLMAVIAANTVNFINNIAILRLSLPDTPEASIPVLAMFFILLKITSYLIITPGNLGVREIAYAFLGGQLHLDPGRAMALSLLYRVLGMISILIFGVYFGGLQLLRSPDAIEPAETESHNP
jgi:uncharacterized membrane protein YbhN (UPF0104 family)